MTADQKKPGPDELTDEQLEEACGGAGSFDTCAAPGGSAPLPYPVSSSSSSSSGNSVGMTSGDESGAISATFSGSVGGTVAPNSSIVRVTPKGTSIKIGG